MQLGSFIKSRRNNIGITQRELADKLNVTVTTVSKWESNQAVPGFRNMNGICEVLGMKREDFVEKEVK